MTKKKVKLRVEETAHTEFAPEFGDFNSFKPLELAESSKALGNAKKKKRK